MTLEGERRWFFWRAGLPRSLAESLLFAIPSSMALLSLSQQTKDSFILLSLLLVSVSTALVCALRLRVLRTGRLAVLAGEVLAALALSLTQVMAAVLVLFAFSKLNGADAGGAYSSTYGLVAATSGAVFLGLRAVVHVWLFWDGLRRQHLVWSLTHGYLTVAVTILFPLIFFAAAVLSTQGSPGLQARSQEGIAAELVVSLVIGFFPAFGFLVVLATLGLLAILSPIAFISYVVARRTVRRLTGLARAAEELRLGHYETRVAVEGEDEVARLQANFNAMVAELERTLSQLQAERDRVEALLDSRRALFAGVSHELRTPVSIMRGYLESTLSHLEDRSPDSLKHDLEVMEREITSLQSLIDDLFTLARAESAGLCLEMRAVDAREVVARLVDTTAPLAWRTGKVEVLADLSDDPALAHADEARLEQVVGNLLRNAVRYTPPGGIVMAIVSPEPETVAIQVRDTGDGIAPEDLPHVWERFFRTQAARAIYPEGTGLGLALVKELTEAMGGSVAVESAPGQGSCFTVRLPHGRIVAD